jgi:hypothetical protein
MTATVVAGERPVGRCPADGSHRWATVEKVDNEWAYTAYDGWLIDSETKTTDDDIAGLIEQHLIGVIEDRWT